MRSRLACTANDTPKTAPIGEDGLGDSPNGERAAAARGASQLSEGGSCVWSEPKIEPTMRNASESSVCR